MELENLVNRGDAVKSLLSEAREDVINDFSVVVARQRITAILPEMIAVIGNLQGELSAAEVECTRLNDIVVAAEGRLEAVKKENDSLTRAEWREDNRGHELGIRIKELARDLDRARVDLKFGDNAVRGIRGKLGTYRRVYDQLKNVSFPEPTTLDILQ